MLKILNTASHLSISFLPATPQGWVTCTRSRTLSSGVRTPSQVVGLQGPHLDHQALPYAASGDHGLRGSVAPPLLTSPLVLSSLGRMFPDVQARQAGQPRVGKQAPLQTAHRIHIRTEIGGAELSPGLLMGSTRKIWVDQKIQTAWLLEALHLWEPEPLFLPGKEKGSPNTRIFRSVDVLGYWTCTVRIKKRGGIVFVVAVTKETVIIINNNVSMCWVCLTNLFD